MILLQAGYVFSVTAAPVKNGILRVDNQGKILELIDPANAVSIPDQGTIQTFEGFLCPGFVNSHCHLELSYLKNRIPEKTGMTGFIAGMLANRGKASAEEIQTAIEVAEKEMIVNGIVAVGDISNTSDSFSQKAMNNLHYHTFIELFDLGDDKAAEAFAKGERLEKELRQSLPQGHSVSLVPHAPYTVSKKLLSLLNLCSYENNSLMAIHNQESEGENELFMSKTGPLYDFFTRAGFDMDYISKTGFNSLRSTLIHLSNCNKIQLVHNTFTSEDDVHWAIKYAKMIYWCLCVNANLFIEDRMPDIKNFIGQSSRITLGTDSLASNHGLSILEEMKTIARHNPQLSFNEMLAWATINGADFFNIRQKYGSFDPGKSPGINLIEQVDFQNMNLTSQSSVRRLF